MKWPNVKLIYLREIRDQLRDRRTLFTIAVMPMLLYPLMGIALLQVGQLSRPHPTKVWMVNVESLPTDPVLLADNRFDTGLIDHGERSMIEVYHSPEADRDFHTIVDQYQKLSKLEHGSNLANQLIQHELAKRKADVAVYFLKSNASDPCHEETAIEVSNAVTAYMFVNSAKEQSRSAADKVIQVLNRWQQQYTETQFQKHQLPLQILQTLKVSKADIADKTVVRAAMWSKVLPFIVVIWALTGAFYPAVDLCAGEKERGTFETLLSSPAARSEIALGKLLTVMSFSYTTSLLNLISMSFTGIFVASKLGGSNELAAMAFGFPPLASLAWLLVALIPISAFFGAIALAAAAFARSSKEGQYYLVPLMMISMPLMMIPMLPTAKLDFGTSLIPISGLIMLLRHLIEGHYTQILPYFGPVIIVTLASCWFSVRWVIHQFNSESVLFRPSEHFTINVWLKSLMQSRHELPSLGNAVLCGVIILVCKFFLGFAAFTPQTFAEFAYQAIVILVAAIAIPAVLMALILTRNPLKALKLRGCSLPVASAAILLAIFLNPAATWLSGLVMYIYPPGGDLMAFEQLASKIINDSPGFWALLLVFAVAPAIIEELGFRGFILSGLESLKSKWQAILITSLFFGLAHTVIQQSIITFFVGLVLGFIAIQTGSIIPCILYHLVHNGLVLMLSQATPEVVQSSTLLSQILFTENGQQYQYAIMPGIAMSCLAFALLAWFYRLDISQNRTPRQKRSSLQPARNYA